MMFKQYLKPLATGLIISLVMAFVMLKVTMNFQVLLFLGATVFFLGGAICSSDKRHLLPTSILITAIYLALFILIVLKELPVLWYFVPIYFLAALLGGLFANYKRKVVAAMSLLSLLMLFLVVKIIPGAIENSLTQNRFDQLPKFTIYNTSGQLIDTKSLKGKVVILDFFGTWCKPCVLELKELDKVKMAFKESEDVVFYIINADLANDTPEKFAEFIEENDYTFQFAYDHDSKIYKALKLQQTGLPTLLVIDKNQNIRKQHIGYNPAETNFAENMIETIKSLQ